MFRNSSPDETRKRFSDAERPYSVGVGVVRLGDA
jgi:hypothetical protein